MCNNHLIYSSLLVAILHSSVLFGFELPLNDQYALQLFTEGENELNKKKYLHAIKKYKSALIYRKLDGPIIVDRNNVATTESQGRKIIRSAQFNISATIMILINVFKMWKIF